MVAKANYTPEAWAKRLADQRERRAKNNNAETKQYEKTPRGFLMRAYRNMQSRVEGVQRPHSTTWRGKELLDRDDFYEWALSDEEFNRLFWEWTMAGYERRLSPSVNRKDTSVGYTLENIEWLTHSENSSLGAKR